MDEMDNDKLTEAVSRIQYQLLEEFTPPEVLAITMAFLADQIALLHSCDIPVTGWEDAINVGVNRRLKNLNKTIN
jgi:hypothetical protein